MEIVLSMADQAKYYAEDIGWRVIPCHWPTPEGGCSCGSPTCKKPGKHPRLSKWQTKATGDAQQINKWWQSWPTANIGLVLGPSSQVFDIEYDDAEGEATAAELLAHIKTPKYKSHRSTHYLFHFAEWLRPPKAVLNWRGLELRFGTDDLGALSIVPPSLHASGNRYEWLLHPAKVGIAEPPAWIPDAITQALEASPATTKPKKSESPQNGISFVMRGEAETLENHPGESEGNRHRKLLELVGRQIGISGANGNLPALALAWGSRCSPPMDQGEVLHVVGKLAEKELSKGIKQGGGGQVAQASLVPPKPRSRTFRARRYSEIEATQVEWLWQDRLPLGKLSLLVGEPGLGKTFCAIDIAAHVSTGSPFIDGARPPLGEVAILTAEDGAGDTIRPRLDAAGADVSKVLHIDGVGADGDAAGFPSLKDDLAPLEQFLKDNPELRLVIIDPLAAYLGDKIDSHSNTQVRSVLGPLCELCERSRVALLGITHLAKGEAKAINRVIGSIAFVAAARSCWLIAADKDEQEKRLFLSVKNNLARSTGLSYSVVDGRCQWNAEAVMIAADEISETGETPRGEARNWLLATLADGPKPSKLLLERARADGISEKTLRRAQKELGIEPEKVGDSWSWRLPSQQGPGIGIFEVE